MKLIIPNDFKKLCQDIVDEQRQASEWAPLESDDMFQALNFTGGFDATENAFCFSYYDEYGKEFWFQVTLDEVIAIAGGKVTALDIHPAE